MKKKIGELLLQIIPVMIGVYLGFLVSNWSENRRNKQDSEVFVSNLISEIKTNKQGLENVIGYHEMVRDSSRYYANDGIVLEKPPAFFQGTRVIKLSNSAFNTGVQTGTINELSIDEIQMINRLYTFQTDYNEFGNLLMSNLISKNFSNNQEDMKNIIRFLSLTMTDVVIKESNLLEGYDLVIEMLEGRS